MPEVIVPKPEGFMSYRHILAPLTMRGVTIKNRVVRAAHGSTIGAQEPGSLGPKLIAYHLARAKGGVGLSILEVCSVHSSSYGPMRIYEPGLSDGYRRLVDVVAPTGMRLMQQLWHAGHSGRTSDGSPPWAPSDIPSPLLGIVPTPMSKGMIDELVGGYAKGARLARECGLDGVEIHAAHTYLVQQFLSPALNRRQDEYGGPFENRARFLMEILAACRRELGEHLLLSMRIGPDGLTQGMTQSENRKVLHAVEATGLIDFVNLSTGSYFDMPAMIGPMSEPTGYQLPSDEFITASTKLPRLVTGRFRTLQEADQLVRLGQAEMVSMVRATIADPNLVRKTMEGREQDVRPCIACNQACVANINRGGLSGLMPMSCAVNPTTSLEWIMRDDEVNTVETPRTVLVVGGGPAGMEAARMAALRGNRVTLVEASKDLGGQVNFAMKAPFRHTIGDIAHWLEGQLYKLDVEIRLSTFFDADDVLATCPDVVITATGSSPRMDGVSLLDPSLPTLGIERAHVLSSHDFMSNRPVGPIGHAIVSDDVGHYEGIAVAETMLQWGASEVTFVTRFNSMAPQMEFALSAQPARIRLYATRKFRVIPNAMVASIGNARAVLRTVHGSMDEEVAADTVVLISANSRNCLLHEALSGRHPDVRIIGDALSPRFLEAAIADGNRVGRSI